MKLIISGSRHLDFKDKSIYYKAQQATVELGLHGGHPTEAGDVAPTVTEVISGGARGADRYGEDWASCEHIPVKIFPAEWDTYGKKAGPIRNKAMAEYGDILLLIWDGKSPGSKNMKNWMKYYRKPIHEVIIEEI